MGFMEKIMGMMNEAPTNTAPENSTQEAVAKTMQPLEQAPIAADERNAESASPKSYTQGELDALLEDKKKEWLEEQQAAEQERIRSLPEAERLKREQLSKDDEIARLQSELTRRDLQAEIIAKLSERRLPTSIAEFVQYGDKESTMKSLDKVMGAVEAAVQEGVMLRLRGKTPEGLGRSSICVNSSKDPFVQSFESAFKK